MTTSEYGAIKITASIGITPMLAGHDLGKSIEFADKALYRAKKYGPDCVKTRKSGQSSR
jgi:GGDEF domain-containing protein